jgi:hypothetical protein
MNEPITEHSKFWLGDKYHPSKTDLEQGMTIWQLAAYRRAIANFVFILTGQNIPVRFAENETSLTDGEVIYIGGELSKGEFDPTVGLSLHEAMHIVKSDFTLIKLIWGKIPDSLKDAAKGKISNDELGQLAKYVLNVVEDRYIDAWAYENAPGYRGYYQALYSRYFYLPEISEALKSGSYREPTIDNYRFRFTNIVNPDSDLDALPGLRRIYQLLDMENILRPNMKTPEKRMNLAMQITEEIVINIVKAAEEKEAEQSGGDGDGDEQNDAGEGKQGDDAKTEQKETPADEKEPSQSSNGDIKEERAPEQKSSQPSPKPLNESKTNKVKELIEKQDQFISREIKQKTVSQDVLNRLKTLEQNDVTIVRVGGEEDIPEVNCIFVKRMTKELMNTPDFPYTPSFSVGANVEGVAGVADGVALGKMLGRRLQLRNDARVTKFNRLEHGCIDKRLLASLGYGNEDVFYQTSVDKYKNTHVHISVDASSSMHDKWRKTIATVVAIAKATSMVSNVTTSISFRSGIRAPALDDASNDAVETPYIVMAYDSRVDKFEKIVHLFPLIFPGGNTPEGLAFQAILDNIPEGTHELDSYFVNISDGQPFFDGAKYSGEKAARHTQKQVNKIRETGVSVLGYFVESLVDEKKDNDDLRLQATLNRLLFRTMYGRNAQFIDVQNVGQIAHTLNKMFLSKESSGF